MAAARRTGTPSVEVDVKLIAQLRPDVILGQSLCEVCAVGESGLGQLVAALNPTPWVVMLHAHTLDGVLADIRKVGAALNLEDEADEVVAGLRYRLRRIRQAHAPRPSGSPLGRPTPPSVLRSEEHTSELQSRLHLVCRLLLEKKKNKTIQESTRQQDVARHTVDQSPYTHHST